MCDEFPGRNAGTLAQEGAPCSSENCASVVLSASLPFDERKSNRGREGIGVRTGLSEAGVCDGMVSCTIIGLDEAEERTAAKPSGTRDHDSTGDGGVEAPSS